MYQLLLMISSTNYAFVLHFYPVKYKIRNSSSHVAWNHCT